MININNGFRRLTVAAVLLVWIYPAQAQSYGAARRLAREAVRKAESRGTGPPTEQHTEQPEPLTVEQIVAKADKAMWHQGRDCRAEVSMVIVDPAGRKSKRRMIVLRRDALPPMAEQAAHSGRRGKRPSDTGHQKFCIFVRGSTGGRSTSVLVWKQPTKPDQQWLYNPASGKVSQLAPSHARASFVGSHFCLADLTGRDRRLDFHELVEVASNADHYVIRSTPIEPASAAFAYRTSWIRRETFLIDKIIYYDRTGRAYRKYEAKQVKTIQGIPTVTVCRMTDLKTKAYTELTRTAVKYNVGLAEGLFTVESLRKGPGKYASGQ